MTGCQTGQVSQVFGCEVGSKMNPFRWGLEPKVVTLDWVGNRRAFIAFELRSNNYTSRVFSGRYLLDGFAGNKTPDDHWGHNPAQKWRLVSARHDLLLRRVCKHAATASISCRGRSTILFLTQWGPASLTRIG
jgi:hypothetical protein